MIVITRVASWLKRTSVTASSCPPRITGVPLPSVAQTRARRSAEPVTTRRPSGLNAPTKTLLVWPRRIRGSPPSTLQIRARLSPAAVRILEPSGLNAMSQTTLSWRRTAVGIGRVAIRWATLAPPGNPGRSSISSNRRAPSNASSAAAADIRTDMACVRRACCRARTPIHTATEPRIATVAMMAAAAKTGTLCLAASLRNRYVALGGLARTGSSVRWRSMSAANSEAEP